MAIKQGNKVKVEYTGSFDDGTVFDSSEGREPLEFEAGSGQLIKGFDQAVIGMEKGQEKTIKIKSSEAYGDVNPELIQKIPRDKIPREYDLKVGMILGLGSPDGHQMQARVAEVTSEHITLDLNHPLAGKTLNFKIKVVDYS
jgi:FKBP-type peptidyl-prolyl cis-trans isomerase 2